MTSPTSRSTTLSRSVLLLTLIAPATAWAGDATEPPELQEEETGDGDGESSHRESTTIGRSGLRHEEEDAQAVHEPVDKTTVQTWGLSWVGAFNDYADAQLFGVTSTIRRINPKGDFPGPEGGTVNALDLRFGVGFQLGKVDVTIPDPYGGASTTSTSIITMFQGWGGIGLARLRYGELDKETKQQNGRGFDLGLNLGVQSFRIDGTSTPSPLIAPNIGFESLKYNAGTAKFVNQTFNFMVIPVGGLTISAAFSRSFG